MNLNQTTIIQAGEMLRTGEITCVQLATQAFEMIKTFNPIYGAYTQTFESVAIQEAMARDQELRAGHDRGLLHGIPIGVKANVAVRETATAVDGRWIDPSWYRGKEGTAVSRLRDAGAIILGKTSTSDSPARNPWNQERWPGGSSTGSAIGLAAGMMLGAVGIDSGGSIRCPAAFCGITGFKPAFGTVAMDGCEQVGISYDCVGPMARSARDCAIMFDAIAEGNTLDVLTEDLAGVRIGVHRQTYLDSPVAADPGLEDSFEEALGVLRRAGARTVESEVPHAEALSMATMLAYTAEGYALNRTALQERYFDYSPAVRARLFNGILLSAGDLVQINRVRTIGKRDIDWLFASGLDAVVEPTAPAGPKPLSDSRPLEGLPSFTAKWNAIGYSAASVPMGFTHDRMPLGLQIAAPTEGIVLRVADALQQRSRWHLQTPELSTAYQEIT